MVSPCNKRKFIKGKPLANNQERKPTKTKLSYKPLLNKRFYLDVNNYKGIENLKIELTHLGAIIDDFIVREVNYVITVRNLNPSTRDSSSEATQPSPNTFPLSPSTPQPPSSIQSTSCDSPTNPDSSKDDKKRARTRAEVLLERACLKRQGTSDVLENARLWAIPVWSLAKLLKWLSGLKESPLYRPPRTGVTPNQKKAADLGYGSKHSSSGRHSTSSSKLQRLNAPFIKIEGFKREHRPQFLELQKWPVLNLNCSRGVSPFTAEQRSFRPERRIAPKHKDTYTDRPKSIPGPAPRGGRGGYCELCSTNFADLKLHLRSESHVAFVRDTANYASLDKLIGQYEIKKD